jgi:hypothetical protein
MKTGTVHTAFGPRDFAIEVYRTVDDKDYVRISGVGWTPRDADEIARLIAGAALIAAAHNAGAIA